MTRAQLEFDFDVMETTMAAIPPPPSPPPSSRRDTGLEVFCANKLAALENGVFPVRVFWSNRMKTTAGSASWRARTITLNSALKSCGAAEIEKTLLHELAHLLAHHRADGKRIYPHGMAWHNACKDLGIADERRCHDLPFERKRREPRFFYACPNCSATLARVRPLRRKSACSACCKAFNNGRYDEKFRFQPVAPKGRGGA